MVTLRESLTQTSKAVSLRSWAPMSQLTISLALPMQTRLSESNCHSSSWSLRILRSISHSRFRYLMIKTSEGGSVRVTIKVPHVWSHSSVPCLWDWMRGGTKFNSTCLISQEELMVQTILRPYVCRFMQTAVFEEFTSLIDSTQKMNYHQSSSSSFQWLARPNNDCPLIDY